MARDQQSANKLEPRGRVGRKGPGQTKAAEGPCTLPAISLETGWVRLEPRGAEGLRPHLQQARQLVKKKQSSHVRKCPHIEEAKKKKKKKEDSVSRQGDFQLFFVSGDVSGSQLQTVAWGWRVI